MTTGHGGKRDNAGRKKLIDSAKKQTTVIRIDTELLPAIEQLKQGMNPVTDNQDELEHWKRRNIELVVERDSALHKVAKLTAELVRLHSLTAKNGALKAKLNAQKTHLCQCLTAKGLQCNKPAMHENKINGFVVFTCERHYQTKLASR